MSEKVKIVPNPEVETVSEETEPESKSKFPTKLIRNIVIGAVGVAITGYVVSKLRNKDDDEADSNDETPWVNVFVPAPTEQASGE